MSEGTSGVSSVPSGLDLLVSLGLINVDACNRVAPFLTALKTLQGAMVPTPAPQPVYHQVRQPVRRAASRKRNSLVIDRNELEKLYRSMTAKEIAELKGVSTSTVNARLRQYQLTTPRKRSIRAQQAQQNVQAPVPVGAAQ